MRSNDINYMEDITAMPVKFREIFELMKDDADGDIETAYLQANRLFISGGKGSGNGLMLRLGTRGDEKLTIARIKFMKQRQGNGTRLVELLMEYGRKEGYEILEVECIHSDEMEAFVIKNGFEQEKLPPLVASVFKKTHSDYWIKQI